MSESWIIEVGGDTAGIIVREAGQRRFAFHASATRFSRFDGLTFSGPRDAERSLKQQVRQQKARSSAPNLAYA